jgi:hypothetical protein
MAPESELPERPPADALSRYSADGKWWWDGEQWVPMDSKPGPMEEFKASYEPSVRRRWLFPFWVLAAGLIITAVLALIAATASLAGLQLPFGGKGVSHVTHPSPTVHARPSPSLAPSPRPTPSPSSGQSQATRYIQLVSNDAQRMNGQIDAVNRVCANQSNLPACRAALVGLQNAVHDFERDLAATEPPKCLQSTDGELRQGLGLFDQGVGTAISGIDQGQPNRTTSGIQSIQQGNDHLNRASSLAQSASC